MSKTWLMYVVVMAPIIVVALAFAIIMVDPGNANTPSTRGMSMYTVTFLTGTGEPVRKVTARYRDICRYSNKVVVTTKTGILTWTGSWEMEMEEGKGKVKE
jgi:hypothetical protein